MIADKVGKWGFLYDEPMRAFWEARLRDGGALSGDALAEALRAVEQEASLARLEITAPGELCSFVGDEPLYRARLRVEAGDVCFDKPPGVRVTLTLVAPDELVADEPGKPPMRFRRAPSAE